MVTWSSAASIAGSFLQFAVNSWHSDFVTCQNHLEVKSSQLTCYTMTLFLT